MSVISRATTADEALPPWLIGELRSDHAGETGAVAIYNGILAVTRDEDLIRFSARHRETEQGHLVALEQVLPREERSALLPVWRVAGWLTGALPALFGTRAVHVTIDAVETFVDEHYQAQIGALDRLGKHAEIRALLEHCRLDEVEHRDEARHLHAGSLGIAARVWTRMVNAGSAGAVALAKRF